MILLFMNINNHCPYIYSSSHIVITHGSINISFTSEVDQQDLENFLFLLKYNLLVFLLLNKDRVTLYKYYLDKDDSI